MKLAPAMNIGNISSSINVPRLAGRTPFSATDAAYAASTSRRRTSPLG